MYVIENNKSKMMFDTKDKESEELHVWCILFLDVLHDCVFFL